MDPIPIQKEPLLAHILDKVNEKLATNFNSILVNFYQNDGIILPYHKDDEKKIRQISAHRHTVHWCYSFYGVWDIKGFSTILQAAASI